jgi:hypothetical protein
VPPPLPKRPARPHRPRPRPEPKHVEPRHADPLDIVTPRDEPAQDPPEDMYDER